MSDVVATILLLALTVTLFASIFFFVNTFPAPPPQPENQFTATLSYTGNAIATVKILHLAGPAIPGNDQVYITSAAHPSLNPPPFTVQQGLASGSSWALGQVWSKDITSYGLTLPDNVTISIVSASELLFRVALPGSNPNVPPTFIGIGYTPLNPSVGQSFTIFTQIQDSNLKSNSVYVNLSQLPGGSGTGTFPMTYSASSGQWSYVVPAGRVTGPGTFYVFLNASDQNGLANSVVLTVTIVAPTAPLTITLTATPILMVTGSATTLLAQVTNQGTGSGLVTVSFTANGAPISTSSAPVAGGSTGTFTAAWTPSAVGVYSLVASATLAGGSSSSSTLNVTVFPPILLLSHNVPSGTMGPDNTSAWLAQELTSASIPYSTMFVSCKTSLTSSLFTGYKVAIVDFGATWTGGCPKSASTTDEGAITGATSTSMWVVGANAFGATTCASFQSNFFSLLGAKWTSGSTCMTLPNATGTAVYAASLASGLRGDGYPASVTVNRTLAGLSNNVPYDSFNLGASPNTAYLTVGGKAVGTWASGAVKGAALATEPALLAAALPNTNNWGTGAAGTAVVYNVVDWLCGLSNSTATGRALVDFAVAETSIVGVFHSALSSVFVGLRSNGPVGGAVNAILYVNGSVALLNGAPVSVTGVVGANGGLVFVTLVWEAPSTGRYTLSVVITTSVPDYNLADNQMGFSIINQATNFS